jgi:hypothetical protein
MTQDEAARTGTSIGWQKSSHSGSEGGNCVEVAHTTEFARVRDSKNPVGPQLRFAAAHWAAFVDSSR